jgi:hypothetical protein
VGFATLHNPTLVGVVLFALVSLTPAPAGSGDLRLPEFAPLLTDRPRPEPPGPLELLRRQGRLTATVRIDTYDERLQPHPVIEEAAAILVDGLKPWAAGVYLTSLSRAPDEQRELMRKRPYRFWAIERSKHLMGGFAADLGFVRRRTSMAKLRDLAEALLRERMGEEKARLVRVVAESRCIHIEIDSRTGREDIEARANVMHRWGIVKSPPDDENPVPHIKDYVPEAHWTKRPKRPLRPAPG